MIYVNLKIRASLLRRVCKTVFCLISEARITDTGGFMRDIISGYQTTMRAEVGPVLREAVRDSDFAHVQLANISQNFAHEKHENNLTLHWLLKWVDGGAVVLSTFVAAWAARLFLNEHEVVEQLIPDLIAVLAFFVIVRLR
jgi:hypothetical protein